MGEGYKGVGHSSAYVCPMIIGIAFLMFRVPAVIKLTIMEVVDEDDCTIAVASNPVENPLMGERYFV